MIPKEATKLINSFKNKTKRAYAAKFAAHVFEEASKPEEPSFSRENDGLHIRYKLQRIKELQDEAQTKETERSAVSEALEYEKIFDEPTMQKLLAQSTETLQKFKADFNNQNYVQLAPVFGQLLGKVIRIETRHKTELEGIAVSLVKELFPIVDVAGIQITAKIVGIGSEEGEMPQMQEGEESDLPDTEDYDELPDIKKRRIINAITHGAAVRGAYSYALYKKALDKFSDGLYEEYNKLLRITFEIYDDPEVLAMIMAMLGSLSDLKGGESSVEHSKDEENEDVLHIHASAVCFPMLVHEIIKGLYEIVSLQGFGPDKEMNKFAVMRADKLPYELDDMRYGKYIFSAVDKLYQDSRATNLATRELLFAEIYKLPPEQFISFVENVIKGTLSKQQTNWVLNTIDRLEKELKEHQ